MTDKIISQTFPYTDQTEELIRERMLSKVSNEWDKTQGSFIWDSLSPAAIEFALAYIRAKEVLEWSFAITTFGTYLDTRAAERGLTRRPAQQASGRIEITGAPNTKIPLGSSFATQVDLESKEDPIYFEVTAEGIIPASGVLSLPIICTELGAMGNVMPGVINVSLNNKANLDLKTIRNREGTTGGVDIETDEAFVERYLEHVRNPGASGNIADYIRWAREADSQVGKVHVLPLFKGPGTLTVLITDIDDRPANASLTTKVQNYIDPGEGTGEGKAPIGAKVYVTTPVVKTIHLKLKLTVIRGYDVAAVRSQVEKNVYNYLRSLVLNMLDNDVRFTKIGNAIGAAEGVQDYEDLYVAVDNTTNWITTNIAIDKNEMAVLGTIQWL